MLASVLLEHNLTKIIKIKLFFWVVFWKSFPKKNVYFLDKRRDFWFVTHFQLYSIRKTSNRIAHDVPYGAQAALPVLREKTTAPRRSEQACGTCPRKSGKALLKKLLKKINSFFPAKLWMRSMWQKICELVRSQDPFEGTQKRKNLRM